MKVLVADDDPGSLLVARVAVEQAGHECLVAADGDAAWHLYQTQQPQVVVTDLKMPGLDGLDLCRAIRGAGNDTYTYLVLLTSHGAREDVLAGMAAGADDYVTKPLDPFTLHTRLLAAGRVTALHAELTETRRALAEQARTDPLTGLHNRLKLTEDLTLFETARDRRGRHYCAAICDVDSFKSFNDCYGHPAGDTALRAVAAALALQARRGDGIYRYGGEEFLFLLPDESPDGAKVLIERARQTVADLEIPHMGSPTGVLTVSAGISGATTGSPVGADRLLSEADAALYEAKTTGRNRVVVASPAVIRWS